MFPRLYSLANLHVHKGYILEYIPENPEEIDHDLNLRKIDFN